MLLAQLFKSRCVTFVRNQKRMQYIGGYKMTQIEKNKLKAQNSFGLLQGSVIFLGLIAIMSAIFTKILWGFKDGSTSANVNTTIGYGEAGIVEVASWLETIGLVVAGTVILGLVFLIVRVAGGGRS